MVWIALVTKAKCYLILFVLSLLFSGCGIEDSDSGNLQTPIAPIENSDGTIDYTLLDREHTGYTTDHKGYFIGSRNLTKAEKNRRNYISILRLSKDHAAKLPPVINKSQNDSSKTKLLSVDNSYIDVFFTLPNFEIVKKLNLPNLNAGENLLYNSDVLVIRVYGQWQTEEGRSKKDSKNYISHLKNKYEIKCQKDDKINDWIYKLKINQKSNGDRSQYTLCGNSSFENFAFYNDEKIFGGGNCAKTGGCIFEIWVNKNRKVNYLFNIKYFKDIEEVNKFVNNFIKNSLVKDW